MRSKYSKSDLREVCENVQLGKGVFFAGNNIILESNSRLDDACIIGDNVVIGQGAWVRVGSVVLHSVPANAIVEGNPARVVGYVNHNDYLHSGESEIVDPQRFSHHERPSRIPLKVRGCELYLLKSIRDGRGGLSVGEVPDELPFSPHRFFTVYSVPSSELRGEHAHKRCKQFLVCLHGSCRVMLDDGNNRAEVLLSGPDVGLFMPEMIWGTQYCYTPDAVLLVLASDIYNSDDYIRSYKSYLVLAAQN